MNFFLFFGVLWLSFSAIIVESKFAYQPGDCEISISNLIVNIFRSEVRAAFNPRLRYSNKKVLRFDLYTPRNRFQRQILTTGDTATLKASNFNAEWPVRFSIHGWMGNGLTCSNAAIKDAYLSTGNFNVIIVDWSAHAMDISYSRISNQLSTIARHLVKFIDFLQRETGIAFEQMQLIGHSAGAHISGWVGKMLAPQRLGAIRALDPAGLVQLGLQKSHRLAKTDAIYVEAIHTDISRLGNPSTDLSQAAFFPNWGLGQPHCPNATAAELDFACDHFAALYYFAESIRRPKLFGAINCVKRGNNSNDDFGDFRCECELKNETSSCAAEVYFGGDAIARKSGVFLFNTRPAAPFGYGSRVIMRPPLPSNFLSSRLARTSRG